MKTRLMDVNLLDVLSRPEHAGLMRDFHARTFTAGASVFEPRHQDNLVFIVSRGRARIYLAYGDKEFTLSILSPGDIYSSHTRASVEALEDLEVLIIPTDLFAEHLADHPALTKTMVHVLGDILYNAFGIINSLAFKDIPRRVTELFLAAIQEHGRETGEGLMVELHWTTEQMAAIVGSTRQSVSETLSRLDRDGLIERRGRGAYRVLDLPGLKALVSSPT